MFWIGLCIGLSVGIAAHQIRHSPLRCEIKRLDREIAADRLAEAKELHYASVLRHVIASEMQADQHQEKSEQDFA